MSTLRPLDLNEPVWFLCRGLVMEGTVYQVLNKISRVHYNILFESGDVKHVHILRRDQIYARKDEAKRLLEELYAIHQETSQSIQSIRRITGDESE